MLEHFTDKFPIYTDVHYRSVHLVKETAFGQKAVVQLFWWLVSMPVIDSPTFNSADLSQCRKLFSVL